MKENLHFINKIKEFVMAINSIGQNLATQGNVDTKKETEDKSILGKDDFMMLLLTQMKYQDPTEPMDTETILTQTSQLATLEASENTNNAIEALSASLELSQQFSVIAAIGKTADLGSNAIGYDKGSPSIFEVYFPQEIKSGTIEILDSNGNIVATMDIDVKGEDGETPDPDEDGEAPETYEDGDIADPDPEPAPDDKTLAAGVHQFSWDGKLSDGTYADSGVYYVTASYTNEAGEAQTTRLGTYPIEGVRFEGGKAYVKVGSNYVPLESIKEVY